MADSEVSASELRRRYQRGGTVPDSELTAAQLRARHGIASNSRDFSTSQPIVKDSSSSILVIVIVAVVLLIAGGVAYKLYS